MIKSTDGEVRELIAALGEDRPARREAAIARLNVIGARAVARLVDAYRQTQDRSQRLAMLRVLETSADERVLPVVREALTAGADLAVAAVSVLGELLARGTPAIQVTALDLLLELSNSPSVERRVRAAAARALEAAPDDVRAALGPRLAEAVPAADVIWEDAAEGRLPDEPSALTEALESAAPSAPLPVLRRLIEAIRAREADSGPGRREQWRQLRGTLHLSLALRGSRIALYDLRETLESAADPLPDAFLAAVGRIGDESCLQALATALCHAPEREYGWRRAIARTFDAIVSRERLTTRRPAMRRALAKAPGLRAVRP